MPTNRHFLCHWEASPALLWVFCINKSFVLCKQTMAMAERGDTLGNFHFSLELKTTKNIFHWKDFVRKHRKALLIAGICWNFWPRQDPAVQESCGWSDSNQTHVFRVLLLRRNEGLVLLLWQNTQLCTGSQPGADVPFLGVVLSLQRTSWSSSILCLHTTKTRVELVLGRISLGQLVRPSLALSVGTPPCLSPTASSKQQLLQLTSTKGLVEDKHLEWVFLYHRFYRP